MKIAMLTPTQDALKKANCATVYRKSDKIADSESVFALSLQ